MRRRLLRELLHWHRNGVKDAVVGVVLHEGDDGKVPELGTRLSDTPDRKDDRQAEWHLVSASLPLIQVRGRQVPRQHAAPNDLPGDAQQMEGLSMTIEQFEKMSPKWIKRTIEIDLVSSTWETFAGPRFKDVSRNGMVLEYSCGPWCFPRNLLITHLNWVDTKDYTVFHRTRLDPSLNGEAGEYLTLDGALRFNPSKGQIENV